MPPGLLVNYWYAPQVGHAIEGLRYALGYHNANPDRRVSLLLNGATTAELARNSAFLDHVYPVAFTSFMEVDSDPAASLSKVPRTWDYLVENRRAREGPHQAFAGFKAFFDASHGYFRPGHPTGLAGSAPPEYLPHQQLRLDPPEQARRGPRRAIGEGRPAISVMLAGSSDRYQYPSNASWKLILNALSKRHPDAVICLIGKLRDDGRTTSGIARDDVVRLLRAVPSAIDCFDRTLWGAGRPDRGVRPSCLAPDRLFVRCLHRGDPLARDLRGQVARVLLQRRPFLLRAAGYGALPVFLLGHAWSRALPVLGVDDDGEGARAPSRSAARIRHDLPELLEKAALLIQKGLTYEEALAEYFPRLLAAYGDNRWKILSFDNIHERYLP